MTADTGAPHKAERVARTARKAHRAIIASTCVLREQEALLNSSLDALEEEQKVLREALEDACEVASWLSALLRHPDGASDSLVWETWEAWENIMRPKLYAALKVKATT